MRAAVLALAVLLVLPRPGLAQDDSSPVNEARRRRDAGDLAGAAALLRPYVARHPEELEAGATLAQILYWLKDYSGARALYEATLAAHPADTPLRLQYGQMLLETGDARRMREVVAPTLDVPAARARAELLLATSAYWGGDLSTAKRLFTAALHDDSTLADARTRLGDIVAASAPWLRVASDLGHDDQPLERYGIDAEAGWYLTPLTTLAAHVTSGRLRSGDSLDLTIGSASLRLTHYAAAIRTEVEAEAGGQRQGGGTSGWTGRLGIGVRLPRHLAIRARGARDVYLYTLASLGTPITTRTATVLLAWNHPRGWLGEAAIQRQWYPDTNAVSTAYAWVLAPVLHRNGGNLQIGYSISAQNAEQSRWVLAYPQQPFPPSDPRFRFDGRYAPYYTPAHLVTHSVLVAAMARATRSLTLRLNGLYGVHATEDAPVLEAGPSPAPGQVTVVRTSYRRTFTPWSGRAAAELAPTGALTVAATAEISRTAFYRTAAAGLQVTWRFGAR